MNLDDYKEMADRCRKFFPEQCEGKDDVTLLLDMHRITWKQSEEMMKEMKKEKVKKEAKEPKQKEKSMTKRQFEKTMKDMGDGIAQLEDFSDSGFAESACYDTAEGIKFTEPDVIKYLEKQGVKDIMGCIADYLYEYAEKAYEKRKDG